MKKAYEFFKKFPVLLGLAAMAMCTASILTLDPPDICFEGILLRVILSFACIGVLFMISGSKVLENCQNRTWYGVLRLSPFLILPILGGIGALFINLRNEKLVDNWPLRILTICILLFTVGIFEELIFRAVINDALLYQFRNKKWVFVAITFISCLVFGWVHVLGTDVSTPLAFAQATMKTITTGLWGFGFLIVYWKTHNIWACAIAHWLYDFLSVTPNMIFEAKEVEYVLEGTMEVEGIVVDKGIVGMAGYIILLLINVVIVLTMIRLFKSIDFKEIREKW